ncbi:hypothetical protein HZC07_02770 [Candidatus Micrarchaeota archaeon]|nr:hypothetical protein [Candidatus Micrarchaeota archaeon]
MRAFVFSLDAFVAFTLALVAIYSLIFFSSIPSSYYYLLTQGHLLSRDVLMTLSTTPCGSLPNPAGGAISVCDNTAASLLDNIALQQGTAQGDANAKEIIQQTVGNLVPNQFGYIVEVSGNQARSWQVVYDTTDPSLTNEAHANKIKKLSVSSQVITFGYASPVGKPETSPYNYRTCSGGSSGIITCGLNGGSNPSNLNDLVPANKVKIIRLTIFI